MQYGDFSFGGTTGWSTKQIQFPVAYTIIPLICVAKTADGKATDIRLLNIQSRSKTGFTCAYYDLTVERSFIWQAVGY